MTHATANRDETQPRFASAPADTLSFFTSPCALGEVLVARSSKGVCAVLIGDTTGELEADLTRRFPKATITVDERAVREDIAKVVRFLQTPAEGLDLLLDARGAPFQRRVSEQFRPVSMGDTVTYNELVKLVGAASFA